MNLHEQLTSLPLSAEEARSPEKIRDRQILAHYLTAHVKKYFTAERNGNNTYSVMCSTETGSYWNNENSRAERPLLMPVIRYELRQNEVAFWVVCEGRCVDRWWRNMKMLSVYT